MLFWKEGDGYPYGNYNENPHSNSNNIGGEGGRMENQFAASSFSDKKIRHAFIRKASYSLSMVFFARLVLNWYREC